MPLLGTKLHVLNHTWKKKKSHDEVQPTDQEEKPAHVVPVTQEVCSSAEELQRKNMIYAANIWTCRVTGKTNLTYKEAARSEAVSHRILKKNFPKFFERPVLEMVHLSTLPLESLVHNCWVTLHEQFYVTEPVKLKVDSVSNAPIHGVISDVDKSEHEPEPPSNPPAGETPATTSPNSSDKENTTSKKTSPVKKNYAYSVKVLSDVPLVVNDVPACSIDRIKKAPSKDHVRLFIRAHAMRYGPNFSGPWIVDADLLRRYKIRPKTPGYTVDKDKVRQMSIALETEYQARIMKANSAEQVNDGDQSAVTPAPIFKRCKRFSVMRTNEDDLPLTVFKTQVKVTPHSATEELAKKKMKQATLFQFKKNSVSPATPTGSAHNHVTSPTFILPRAAQHLLKLYETNHENPLLSAQINICAKLLKDGDLLKLPKELRDRVIARREVVEYRKKLMSMTPVQRKEYLREQREKRKAEWLSANRLLDDQQLLRANSDFSPLPEPSGLHLPLNLTEPLFGRLLGLSEFLHCFQTLLLEGLEEGETDGQGESSTMTATSFSPLDSVVPCAGDADYSDDEERMNTEEEEEEVALIGPTAPLPKVSVRSIRKFGLHRLTKAVAADCPSAGAFRSLSRPLMLLMRLLLRDGELSKERELGLRLTKLPVTPYTAPELLRLALLHEKSYRSELKALLAISSNPVNQPVSTEISPAVTDTANSSSKMNMLELVKQLTSSDLYELRPEARLFALETAVERLFDLDLIDDHLLACQHRASEAWHKKAKVLRERNLRKKEQKDSQTAATHKKEPSTNTSITQGNQSTSEVKTEPATPNANETDNLELDDDLASVVKRRRILAARAAAEREEKEALERERRAVQAQEYAEERALNAVSRLYQMRADEAKCVSRVQPLGYDRYYRRIWYFRSAPDRLFIESNWAPACVDYAVPLSPTTINGIKKEEDHNSTACLFKEEETALPLAAHADLSGEDCTVSTVPSSWSTWCVYDRPEQLDQLVAALLERGIRESALKRHLLADGLINSMKARWMKSLNSASLKPEASKSPDTSGPKEECDRRASEASERVLAHLALNAEAALAGALLKNLLDTEVRLRSGGLGGVPDFPRWQEDLARVHTSFGLPPEGSPEKNPPLKLGDVGRPDRSGLVNALIEVGEHVIPRFLNVPDLLPKREKKSEDVLESTENSVVQESKQSHHTTENAVDHDESDSEDSDSSNGMDKILQDPELHERRTHAWLSCWRTEVQRAQTLSRLNLLHACLDACIRWEKSVEDARCRICRHKSDDDNLLLCDGCNHAFHLYCLRPPLRRVPSGDWFCPSCRPASRDLERRRRAARLARSEQRRRQETEASSDDERRSEDSSSSNSGSDDNDDSESSGQPYFKRSRRSNKRTKVQELRHSDRSVKTDRDKHGVKHDSVCLVCGDATADLVLCSNCPNAFHLSCHNPPLRHPPRTSDWLCSTCRHSRRGTVLNFIRQTRESRRISYQRCTGQGGASDYCGSEEETARVANRSARSSKSRISAKRVNHDFSGGEDALDAKDDSESEADEVCSETPVVRRSLRAKRPAPDSANAARNGKRRRKNSSAEEDSSDEDDASEAVKSTESAQSICTRILNAVYRNRNAWPFREPVDAKEVPDYYEIITNPIDLSKLREKLAQGEYDTSQPKDGVELLMRDLGNMFYNAELYNAADSDVWIAGSQLEQLVRNLFAQSRSGVTYQRSTLGGL
ncbi:unnamed protein product [Calicophoron daubneyi]|uniref:Bromodomain adjacent to zinc finger domain protein 1A n=1 Tax=Calicophoron daubneyi TaxID=300641 RepID=A0AAV2TKK4_CALDB